MADITGIEFEEQKTIKSTDPKEDLVLTFTEVGNHSNFFSLWADDALVGIVYKNKAELKCEIKNKSFRVSFNKVTIKNLREKLRGE